MQATDISTVAVVGAGVIGRSWIRVFARGGLETRVYDPDPAQLDAALAWVEQSTLRDREADLIDADELERTRALVHACSSVEEAVSGAEYVQESGPETLETKQAVYRDLDANAESTAILGSSTSTHDMTAIAAGLPGASRCIVAHPTNPPHIVPAVELVPGRETDPKVVRATLAFLRRVGQRPVQMNFYLQGFILNRLQAALVGEAVRLVERGAADVDAIDTVIRDGIGLRWSLFGPFGVANTNADGGVREYFTEYGWAYETLCNDLGPPPAFDADLVETIGRATDAMEGDAPIDAIASWRDRLVRKIRELRRDDPHPSRNAALAAAADAGEPAE